MEKTILPILRRVSQDYLSIEKGKGNTINFLSFEELFLLVERLIDVTHRSPKVKIYLTEYGLNYDSTTGLSDLLTHNVSFGKTKKLVFIKEKLKSIKWFGSRHLKKDNLSLSFNIGKNTLIGIFVCFHKEEDRPKKDDEYYVSIDMPSFNVSNIKKN
jgi:hypothetical protein